MPDEESSAHAGELRRVGALLEPLRPSQRLWPVVAAAVALLVASLAFAVAMVLAPPVVKEHVTRTAPGG